MNKYDPDYAKYQEWVDGVNRAYYHLLGSGDNFSDHIQDFLFFTAVGFFYWLLLLSGIWMILRGRFFIMLPGDTYPKPYFAYCIGGAYIICWMGNMAPFMSIYGYGLAQIFGYELVFEASEIAFYYGNAFMLFGVIARM